MPRQRGVEAGVDDLEAVLLRRVGPVLRRHLGHVQRGVAVQIVAVGLVAFAHGINRDLEHAAGEDLFRIKELRRFSHALLPDKLQEL